MTTITKLTTLSLINGDCLEVMKTFPDNHFDAASFSPPYGLGGEGFDIRYDFRYSKTGGFPGKFMAYMVEACRVSKVVAINLTQRVIAGRLSTFTEEFTLDLQTQGIHLFDRWVVTKPTAMPKRGERALTNYEFVLLFSRDPEAVKVRPDADRQKFKTVIPVSGSHNASNVRVLGTTPYFPEIPRQVFSLYGHERVLDPFAGSGTSLSVAEDLGLDSVGIELNPEVYAATMNHFFPK